MSVRKGKNHRELAYQPQGEFSQSCAHYGAVTLHDLTLWMSRREGYLYEKVAWSTQSRALKLGQKIKTKVNFSYCQMMLSLINKLAVE
jgi:DNA helicase TIP49 (TBP-interacting protein)